MHSKASHAKSQDKNLLDHPGMGLAYIPGSGLWKQTNKFIKGRKVIGHGSLIIRHFMPGLKAGIRQTRRLSVSHKKFLRYFMPGLKAGIRQANLPSVSSASQKASGHSLAFASSLPFYSPDGLPSLLQP